MVCQGGLGSGKGKPEEGDFLGESGRHGVLGKMRKGICLRGVKVQSWGQGMSKGADVYRGLCAVIQVENLKDPLYRPSDDGEKRSRRTATMVWVCGGLETAKKPSIRGAGSKKVGRRLCWGVRYQRNRNKWPFKGGSKMCFYHSRRGEKSKRPSASWDVSPRS